MMKKHLRRLLALLTRTPNLRPAAVPAPVVRNRFWTGIALTLLATSLLSAPALAQPSKTEMATHLKAIDQLTTDALAASKKAETAASVAEVKREADIVFASIWGITSGLADGALGAEKVHDWKSRWQSDTDDFELETPEKFGVLPAAVTDPALMGIVGRGRYVRDLIKVEAEAGKAHFQHTFAALNNVIGWQRMDYAPARGGMPRVDLTAQWDAPSEFWLSSADTGWIFDAYSQAVNILKTSYGDDIGAARKHAAGMTQLLEKVRAGVDANGNNTVEPAMMEGGLDTALQHARLAGINLP
ncbi:MAG: hypothetical protein SH809_10280 [Rhodothermales bacterium]|nr:hypothetical protein [Rhodothermales bacterium]